MFKTLKKQISTTKLARKKLMKLFQNKIKND